MQEVNGYRGDNANIEAGTLHLFIFYYFNYYYFKDNKYLTQESHYTANLDVLETV